MYKHVCNTVNKFVVIQTIKVCNTANTDLQNLKFRFVHLQTFRLLMVSARFYYYKLFQVRSINAAVWYKPTFSSGFHLPPNAFTSACNFFSAAPILNDTAFLFESLISSLPPLTASQITISPRRVKKIIVLYRCCFHRTARSVPCMPTRKPPDARKPAKAGFFVRCGICEPYCCRYLPSSCRNSGVPRRGASSGLPARRSRSRNPSRNALSSCSRAAPPFPPAASMRAISKRSSGDSPPAASARRSVSLAAAMFPSIR